ncbi:MAG: HAMP domain-containing sensor histidine kinase, partial [Pseudomonadota bacterium]
KPRESHFGFEDIHDLIEKMVLLISLQSKAKQIEVVRNFDPRVGQVWMDAEKMKQVILNLLSNAVDFSPEEGGRIEVSTRNSAAKGGKPRTVRIEVKDNGIGIPPAFYDKIFEPYFTTKHKSNMHSGTGLGLFVVHQNMQDHGGTIEVKGTLNLETTFILTLPAEPSMGSAMNSDMGYPDANRPG